MMRTQLYTDQYKKQLINFIDNIYKEYGDQIYTEGFDKDLLNIEDVYEKKDGRFWLCVNEKNEITGTIAFKINNKVNKIIEIKRFYLRQKVRGTGLADKLFNLVLNWCNENNYEKIILWSDIRFTRAHSYYTKKGFVKTDIRDIDDGAMPYSEYCFELNNII